MFDRFKKSASFCVHECFLYTANRLSRAVEVPAVAKYSRVVAAAKEADAKESPPPRIINRTNNAISVNLNLSRNLNPTAFGGATAAGNTSPLPSTPASSPLNSPASSPTNSPGGGGVSPTGTLKQTTPNNSPTNTSVSVQHKV